MPVRPRALPRRFSMSPARRIAKTTARVSKAQAKPREVAPRYKNDAFEALRRSASALHEVGAMDVQTMRNFDAACIESPGVWSKKKIQLLRQRFGMSQP